MTVKIHIVYCGACGYAPKFQSFERDLRGKLVKAGIPSSDLEITGEKTSLPTGKFEVFADDELVHSKTDRDQGFVDTEEKMQAVINAILHKK
jgi:selT/selW/selH-like putative selenoprotein